MNSHVIFQSGGTEYHAEAWYDERGVYDCTECYTFTADGDSSIDADWEQFREEITFELREEIEKEKRSGFGYYDEDSYMEHVYYGMGM
jgi:hypothetical protein